MGLQIQYFNFLLILILVVIFKSNTKVNCQVEGCSLVGLDLQHCLNPSTPQTQPSLDSCCTALNQAVQAGYYCLCSLLGPSNHPFFGSAVALSFANCYVWMPPLTHCNVLEPGPLIIPPVAPIFHEPPASPVQTPPEEPRDDFFVPLPPKVNEVPLNSTRDDNSTVIDRETPLRSSSMPKLNVPERWKHIKSDGANVKILIGLHSRLVLLIISFCCAYVA